MEDQYQNILSEDLNTSINSLSEEQLEDPEVIFGLISKLQGNAFELGASAVDPSEVDVTIEITSDNVSDLLKALIARGNALVGIRAIDS